jgi:hypothetical protein
MVAFGALLQPNMPRNALFPLQFSLACLYLLQLLEKPPKTLLESAIGMPKMPQMPQMPQTFTWTSLDFLIVVQCSNGLLHDLQVRYWRQVKPSQPHP